MAKMGHPKYGGRVKGTPNKVTFDLMQSLKEKGFEPAAELVRIHALAMEQFERTGRTGMLELAQRSASDLMEYVYPKRKAVELTGAEGADLFQSFTKLVQELKSDA